MKKLLAAALTVASLAFSSPSLAQTPPNVLVVGLPLNMDGSASDMSERAARFARRLNGRFQLPVETVDERLSTFEAKQHLKDQGRTPSSYREDPVDSLAAALLLQTWLSSQSKET